MTKGCELCRQAILTGSRPPPTEMFVSDRLHARLAKCEHCNSFWQIEERHAYVINEKEAKETFPEAFQ